MTGKLTEGCLPSKMDSADAGPLSQPVEDLSSQEQELPPPSISPTSTQPLESPSLLPDSQEEEEEAWGQLKEETEETFPEELTAGYTVSKVLGSGASAEVRLAFRRPDMHRVALKIIRKKNNSALGSCS